MAQASKTTNDGVGFGVTSMVTGILSLILFWAFFINFALSVVAVIFGILGLKRPQSKGMSIAGLVTGGIGLLISVLQGFFWIAVIISTAASS